MPIDLLRRLFKNDNIDTDMPVIMDSSGQKLAENLVNVLVAGLDREDDMEAHENVLQVLCCELCFYRVWDLQLYWDKIQTRVCK